MHVTLVLTILLNMYVSSLLKLTVTLTFTPKIARCAFTTGLSNITVCCSMSLFVIPEIDYFWFLAAAIIFTIIALFSIFTYFAFRSRIPLASLLLQVVMDVSKHHKSVFAVAFAACSSRLVFRCMFNLGVFPDVSDLPFQLVHIHCHCYVGPQTITL
jgi:hypothetical protein